MDNDSAILELILAVRGLAAECDHSSDKSAYLPHLDKARELVLGLGRPASLVEADQNAAKQYAALMVQESAPVVDGSKDHIALVPPADEEV